MPLHLVLQQLSLSPRGSPCVVGRYKGSLLLSILRLILHPPKFALSCTQTLFLTYNTCTSAQFSLSCRNKPCMVPVAHSPSSANSLHALLPLSTGSIITLLTSFCMQILFLEGQKLRIFIYWNVWHTNTQCSLNKFLWKLPKSMKLFHQNGLTPLNSDYAVAIHLQFSIWSSKLTLSSNHHYYCSWKAQQIKKHVQAWHGLSETVVGRFEPLQPGSRLAFPA